MDVQNPADEQQAEIFTDEDSNIQEIGANQRNMMDAFNLLAFGAQQQKLMEDLMKSTMAEYKEEITSTILAE